MNEVFERVGWGRINAIQTERGFFRKEKSYDALNFTLKDVIC